MFDSIVQLIGEVAIVIVQVLAIILLTSLSLVGGSAILTHLRIPYPWYIAKSAMTGLFLIVIAFIPSIMARSYDTLSPVEFALCIAVYTMNVVYQGLRENTWYYIGAVILGYVIPVVNYVYLMDTFLHRLFLCWIIGDVLRLMDEFCFEIPHLEGLLTALYMIPCYIEKFMWIKVPFITLYVMALIFRRFFTHIQAESPFPDENHYNVVDFFKVIMNAPATTTTQEAEPKPSTVPIAQVVSPPPQQAD